MAKRKNSLPSGNFRVLALDYTDPDGKRHYKSFTAPTKKEARMLADEWKLSKKRNRAENISVRVAVQRYKDMKAAVLSPSTLRGYAGLLRTHFQGDFGSTRLNELNSQIVQIWISDLSKRLSPKTVRNAYALLTAALDMFAPDLSIRVQLPARKHPELYCPNDTDIQRLLAESAGTDLEIAILLAAFGPLRRGEICALTSRDIKGNTITVSKSIVRSEDNEWITKSPKTYGSYRTIQMPEFFFKHIRSKKGALCNLNPDQLTREFERVLDLCQLPHFRFHDLRHYSASIMHAIGVPDQYIMQRGGWSSDNVMKSVYRNVIDLEAEKQSQLILEHFQKVADGKSCNTKCNTMPEKH